MRTFVRLACTASALLFLASCNSMGQAPTQTSHPPLGGTSWQLIGFSGGDGAKLAPDDRSKYALTFGTDGMVSARIDCNRGRGSWKSTEPGQLEFGALATTRAMCAPGSMHDQIVKHLPAVRTYVVKGGHLFLSLMADGGIYELEPAAGA